MAGKPYQSKLMPYEYEIITLRRKKRPVSYSQIAELLREKYQLTISRGTIFSFIKLRVKKVYKPCKYDAWDIELSEANNQPTTEATVIEKPTVSKPPDKPEQVEEYKPKPFNMKFSETYNLHRLPPEEAAARRKIIEEKERERERTWRDKASQSESKQPVPEKSIAAKPPDKPAPTEELDIDDYDLPKFEDVMKYSDNYNLTLMSPEEAKTAEELYRKKNEREKLKAMQDASKPAVPDKPKQHIAELETELDILKLPELKYSDTYNLTRLSDAEAAKWLKLIEERKMR